MRCTFTFKHKMKYRPEIDGLRAVAVIPVILFHAGYESFSGGFVGVDVFFVISGYLITTILLSEIEEKRFSFIKFYERRARRILPALFLVISFSILTSWMTLNSTEMRDFLQSIIAVMTFSSNILFWIESGYFDTASELKPLLHTWSLAIEEQFYIFFPIFLILLWRFGKRWIFAILVSTTVLSLLAAQWGAYNRPNATFFLLPTRAWELSIGSIAAFLLLYRRDKFHNLLGNRLIAEIASIFGVLMIAGSVFAFDKSTPFPSIYALFPTVGTMLVILYGHSNTAIGKLLSNKLLVGVGLVSYSAYLWHQPIFTYARYQYFPEPPSYIFVLLIILTMFLAYLSWKYIESPFRNKQCFSRRKIFIFSCVGSLIFALFALFGIKFDGFNYRALITQHRILNYELENNLLQAASWKYLQEISGDPGYAVENNKYDRQSWWIKPDAGKRKILIIGNSHSKDIFNVVLNSDYVGEQFQIARFGVQISDLLKPDADLFQTPNYAEADLVMLATRYSEEDLEALQFVVERIIGDKKEVILVRNIYEFPDSSNRTIVDMLMIQKYRSDFVAGIPQEQIAQSINRDCYGYYSELGKSEIAMLADEIITGLVNENRQVTSLDRMDYILNKEDRLFYSIDARFQKFFYDYGHHTLAGSEFFGQRISEIGWLDAYVEK